MKTYSINKDTCSDTGFFFNFKYIVYFNHFQTPYLLLFSPSNFPQLLVTFITPSYVDVCA